MHLLDRPTRGEVVLGSKKVPIVNPVTLQGGYGVIGEDEFSKFYAATNGVTLSKAAQPVPGGLAGIVNCKEINDFFLRFSCEVTFENGLTGLNSTLELAKPASEIRISENNLAGEIGTALETAGQGPPGKPLPGQLNATSAPRARRWSGN